MKRLGLFGLFAVWIVLAGNVNPGTIVIGLGLSVAAMLIFSSLASDREIGARRLRQASPNGRTRTGLPAVLRRLFVALLFLPIFLAKVFLSGVSMAFLALRPSLDFWPGIVRVPAGMRSTVTTAIFANAITLTPGTLTLDYDETDDCYYVHWIDVTGYDQDDFDRRVTSGMRPWMERLDQ